MNSDYIIPLDLQENGKYIVSQEWIQKYTLYGLSRFDEYDYEIYFRCKMKKPFFTPEDDNFLNMIKA